MHDFSTTEHIAMDLLLARPSKEFYGMEFVEASDGKLKRGSVYVTLTSLEERGLITSRKEENASARIPKRLYKITALGSHAFRSWLKGKEVQRAEFAKPIPV